MKFDQQHEIDLAINYIHQHIDEPISLSQLASHVAYSPFHFARIFKEKIGLPPLYYVSSLRLQRAKDLLVSTNLNVRDIGLEIGQQSLGTFTTRFTERVGMAPSQFRDSQNQINNYLYTLKKFNDWDPLILTTNQLNNVKGTVQSEVPFNGFILIGLFKKPIPEGLPLYGTLLNSLDEFSFMNVKPGTYYIMATALSWEIQTTELLLPYTTLRAWSRTPINVGLHSLVPHQNLTLHKPGLSDPPILISLPLLIHNFLRRKQDSNL